MYVLQSSNKQPWRTKETSFFQMAVTSEGNPGTAVTNIKTKDLKTVKSRC